MRIKLHCMGPHRAFIEIGTLPGGCLEIRIGAGGPPSHYMSAEIPTKELVMAIKQVEEERDAHSPSVGPYREEPRAGYDKRSLREAISEGIEELRRMLRDHRPWHPHFEEFDEVTRYIHEARSPEEVRYYLDRFTKKHLRPDRLAPRS